MDKDEFILNGLGAAITNKAKELGISADNVAKLGVSTDVLKLLNYFPGLPDKVQAAIRNGNAITYGTEIFSIAKPSANGGVLTQDTIVATPGLTNISNSTFGRGEFFIATGMRLLCSASTGADIAHIDNNTEKFDAILPNDIFTSILEVKKQDKDIIVSTPVSAFHSPIYGYNSAKPYGYLELSNPKFFEENSKYTAKLEKKAIFGGAAFAGWIYFSFLGTIVKA